MNSGLTIGVLSTSFGGLYFGGVLGGIHRATAAAGGRIVALQTLDAGTVDVDISHSPRLEHPVAWDRVSAFIMVLNAANREYLESIQNAGKPLVIISDEVPGLSVPVVLPDNRVGIQAAVDHLVKHGHSDIAFAGHPVHRDFRERYDEYREALTRCGIPPRPELFFDTGNNQESGGEHAARAMLAAGLPSTAVIAGNDLNAVGLMRALTEAGIELPRQQAVVGFDDMDGVVYLTPSLSTVRQPLDQAGGLAVELVLRQLGGGEVTPGSHHVPTEFVARESCGCPDPLALGDVPTAESDEIRSAAQLEASLIAILGGSGMRPAAVAVARLAAQTIAEAILAAAGTGPGPDPFRLRKALAELHKVQRRPESLVEIMRCVRLFGRHLSETAWQEGDKATALRLAEQTQEVVLALAQSQARTQYHDGKYFQNTLNTQYRVSMNLLRSHEEDPRTLTWIEGTHARGGCLGLWANSAPSEGGHRSRLDIVSVFERGRQCLPATLTSTPSAFPPAEVVALAEPDSDDMVFVVPMKVNVSDWGLLAIVGPIEALVPTGREMMNQWTALLTIALDHEAVLVSLREREEMLRHAALYDQLTGLANRTLFLERLQHAIARAKRRPDYNFAVLMLDLDGFKVVNDSLGHLAGDQLLQGIAERLKVCTRETDIAARFGGDEFAILLDDIVDPASPVAAADRIHNALKRPFLLDGEDVVVSSSIGISLSSTGYQHAEDVIRDADTAMYSAKWRGKGSHAVFNHAMHAKAIGRLRTEADLRRGLDLGELEAHYQPIVSLETGDTVAFEALVRWRHPVRGLVGPAEFLPIAEDSGLALPIGRWMLAESCRQLRGWQAAGIAHEGLRMSVNLSNRQFWHGRLLDDIRDCLEYIHPRSLILEITESVITHDVTLAQRMLAELHEMGVQLHIDDFGTGHSSLEVLWHLPIDALKIDRSFVQPLGISRRGTELVRTIVLMGTNLGLQLVAEGIETAVQRDNLREAGCRYGQGYLFSRPMPSDEAAEYLRAASSSPPESVQLRAHDAGWVPEPFGG